MKTPGSIILLTFFLIMYSLTSFADLLKGFNALKRKDYHQSLIYFKPLAEKGDAIAQMNLGIMYEQGHGVSRDIETAIYWFNRAAAQKYALAQTALGSIYERGIGVRQDYVRAYMWWEIAASFNDTYGETLRRLVKKKMSSAQIKRATRRVKNCIKQEYKNC